jgi:hypothetical protein
MQAKEWGCTVRIGIAAALCFLTPLKASSADGLDWVSGVERTTTGVTVYLTQPKRVFVARASGRGGPYVTDSSGRVALAGVVSVMLGDRLSFDTSAHSGCMVDVVIKDGKIGANAYCAVSAPGLPPGRTGTTFIAAE